MGIRRSLPWSVSFSAKYPAHWNLRPVSISGTLAGVLSIVAMITFHSQRVRQCEALTQNGAKSTPVALLIAKMPHTIWPPT
ncbi:hypothetical protein XELAEV_18003025mg [Xenopus laevis]|uniref:Uncharacterized protein n=1 Tax=Xenopus laevis TaxID=8355 RepID=A0A974BN97_XENLA|nr:hypothetical protein XELAEV_18003025mg [Xenopus laevis]